MIFKYMAKPFAQFVRALTIQGIVKILVRRGIFKLFYRGIYFIYDKKSRA